MTVEYRVLGPLEVLLDGEPVAVPAGRGRVLLATLLLRANEFVPVDELVDRVWDGEPPAGDRAYKTLQMTVSRLRQALGEANCLQTSSRGYSAAVSPEQLDLTRFRALTARGDHRAALELWRGPVLANVASESLHRDDVPLLVEEHVVALERRIDQDLGRDTDVLVPELRRLVNQYPLRETFWAQLMLALHRSNQQAEALAVYQEVRDHLADELGVDPGPRLREAHELVLSGEVPAVSVPRQLPAGVPHFVGREHELSRLTEMLAIRPGAPVLISAINGIGGVGKTALALQWAHQVADRFPDGQLYVDLRGFDTRAEPLDPFTVARDFLLALGVAAKDVPASEEALTAAYRSALAQRQVLLVLDNARDVEQVRPLLPGGSANLVLITSRNHLRGLVAREGAQPVALDVLGEQAAVHLLTERIGAAQVVAEPDAVSRLIERCAGLPLALGIVAARAACGDPLAALADELEQERLDGFDVDDPTTGLRAVFSWSLRAVSEQAAKVFLLLGLHPGPDFSVAAAAGLAGLPVGQVRRALGELVASSLVHTGANGRFGLHDLLREFAADCAAELPEEQRSAARQRMFDHYLHTTWSACRNVEGSGIRWPGLPRPAEFVVVEPVANVEAAFDWYDAEHHVLLGVFRQMEETGADDVLWTFAYSVHMYLLRRRHLDEAVDVETRGLAAARRDGSVFGQSRLNRSLAAVHLAKRDFAQAESYLAEALRCDEELDDVSGQLNDARGLAYMCELQGRAVDGLAILHRVHPLSERLESKFEKASFLASYGRANHLAGESERAIELCLEAHALFVELAHTGSIAASTAYETLGDVYVKLGRYAEAAGHLKTSIRMLRHTRDTYTLAAVLVRLAKVHMATGERETARDLLGEALVSYEKQRPEEADEVRGLLSSLD
ncbi:DNA-binding SARP family transcriptional activator [Lentzea atacamensis]|uniref:DNA-binding SARP family transcriptional activator n=1 Tax=Lentzea atacamensis TaxID=531938 RepID=A0A316IF61_9PSEU|nr:BTAD domain-containing putative transcriptional regulator [Lentzea atacamensis]PWK91603.1 DNA-binding SARP family transcriptional activator [Lentzea atacamensis]